MRIVIKMAAWMIGMKVDVTSRPSCSVCLCSVSHFSRIHQTAQTGTRALLRIPPNVCQLCLDPASFRAANHSEGGNSISSAFGCHPSCSSSCHFLQAYRKDPQEDRQSIKAASGEEANHYPRSSCLQKRSRLGIW